LFVLVKLKEFARDRVAHHPGLFAPQTFPSELFDEMGNSGLLGFTNLGDIARGGAILAGETGSLGFATAWIGQSLVPLALARFASLPDDLRQGVKTGAALIALAISEPKAGAHPKYLTAQATRIANGWMLSGEKAYVTNGPIASHIAVLAITGNAASRKEFSTFLLPITAQGLSQVAHPQFDFLRPAQHCGFKLENCFVPESALIGRPGQGYTDVAIPYRSLEDAVGIGSLMAVLDRAATSTAQARGAGLSDEQAIALGELAGLHTALEALYAPVLAAIPTWDIGSDAVSISLVAIHDLARRYIAMLQNIGINGDESISRMLRDAENYLNIAQNARQKNKERLGRSYFIHMQDLSGKYEA
jgi:acyl-CoA dehydrogenase